MEDQEELPENGTEEDELEELPPLEEEDLLNLDIEESIDSASNFPDVVEDQEELPENGTEEDELEGLPPLEEEDLLNLDIEESLTVYLMIFLIQHRTMNFLMNLLKVTLTHKVLLGNRWYYMIW